jgi:hypothetical protein
MDPRELHAPTMVHDGGASRRKEYAEATRQAIIAAARRLFSKQGYFGTKVDDIAPFARVSPTTVYAVTAGKQGPLHTLMGVWTTAPTVGAMIGSVSARATGSVRLGLGWVYSRG